MTFARRQPRPFRILGFVLLVAGLRSVQVRAQTSPSGAMYVRTSSGGAAFSQTFPVMISALRSGQIVNQGETLVAGGNSALKLGELPVGTYDVRVEGEGIMTEVKRGVRVFEGRQAPVEFVIRPGKGVRIVEYSTGGLAREEVATRLDRLESFAKGTVKWFGSDSTHGPVPQF